MPSSSIHPLPANPTTGQQPLASLGGVRVSSGSGAPASGSVGGVSRDTLKGLQDVVWSDDEDDPDCLLCAEPLDLSDLNFKPCQCGMQICQFCYNKLLGSDARCPGCRRPYDAKAVVFQPVDWDEVKRAKEKKTRRAKTIKQLTSMGRRHLLGVRVVVKNTVYVVGMKLPAPGDESIPILRSNDYFGQYGKISRLYLRDRTTLSSTAVHTLTPDDPSTSHGIYIVYVRREDAARAISALDGIAAPQGPPGRILKATYATCRYCDAFLKGQKCDNLVCQNLHEWGGDSDCFTKEDMEIALTRPAEYDARQQEARLRASSLSKTSFSKVATLEDVIGSSLPTSAGWGKGMAPKQPNGKPIAAPIGSSRPVKPAPVAPPLQSTVAFPPPTPSPVNPPPAKEKKSKASSTRMARGKSSDSTQSGTTNSAQASPKKKPAPLATTLTANKVIPIPLPPAKIAPPPGLSRSRDPDLKTNGELSDDLQDESVSAESEAGPSSGSPAPQTPSRSSDDPPLPPPLTGDPICVHSPYEEPRIYPFPASDPAFEFILSLDEDVQRQAQEEYTPSPFGKTLLGLAQLGILAPEVLDPIPRSPKSDSGAQGLFSPFDTTAEAIPESLAKNEEEDKRTTSRFDFARPSSRPSMSREQSPFALRQSDDRTGESSMWGKGLAVDSLRRTSNQVNGFGGLASVGGFGEDGAWSSNGRPQASSSALPLATFQDTRRPQGRTREQDYNGGILPSLGNIRKYAEGYAVQDDPYHGRQAMSPLHQLSSQSPVNAFGSHAQDGRIMHQGYQRAQSPTPQGMGYRRY